jgi:hypothetical protein
MKRWKLLFAARGALATLILALGEADAQVRVFVWLGQDVWHVTEGDRAHDVKFSIVNENDYPVVINQETAYTESTQGDITDSILIDGITQSAFGLTIKPHGFATATVEFSPFSYADAGPPNDGWVDLYYAVDTNKGWGARDNTTVFVSDTPEPSSLLLLGSGVIGLSGFLSKRLLIRS